MRMQTEYLVDSRRCLTERGAIVLQASLQALAPRHEVFRRRAGLWWVVEIWKPCGEDKEAASG